MNEADFRQLAYRALALRPWPDPRFPPSRYYRFFRLLTQAMQPGLSVELGVCGGGASFHMALGWSGGTVVGVDKDLPHPANYRYIRGKCPNWELWRGDSVDDAGAIVEKHGPPSLLFIDTIHTTERTVAEWEAWEPLMTERAVICLDDLQRREMDGLWDWVPWQKCRIDELHDGGLDEDGFGDGGFGVCWRS